MSKDWVLESFRRNEPLHSHGQLHHTCKGGAPSACYFSKSATPGSSNLSCNLVTCSHCAWTTSSAQSRTALTSSGLTWWMSSCSLSWGLDLSFRSAASFPSSMPARFKAWNVETAGFLTWKGLTKRGPTNHCSFDSDIFFGTFVLSNPCFFDGKMLTTPCRRPGWWRRRAPLTSCKLQPPNTLKDASYAPYTSYKPYTGWEREVKYADLFHWNSEIQRLGWTSRCWGKTRCSWKSTSWASFRYVTELGEIETTPWMGRTDMVGTKDDKMMFEHASSGPKLHTNLPSPKSLSSNQNWKGHGPGSLVQSCLVK